MPEETMEKRIDEANGHLIIVNAREKVWLEETISFEELVALSFGIFQPNDSAVYTVIYQKGDEKKPQGSMVLGDTVKVKNNMVFNVTATNKS